MRVSHSLEMLFILFMEVNLHSIFPKTTQTPPPPPSRTLLVKFEILSAINFTLVTIFFVFFCCASACLEMEWKCNGIIMGKSEGGVGSLVRLMDSRLRDIKTQLLSFSNFLMSFLISLGRATVVKSEKKLWKRDRKDGKIGFWSHGDGFWKVDDRIFGDFYEILAKFGNLNYWFKQIKIQIIFERWKFKSLSNVWNNF